MSSSVQQSGQRCTLPVCVHTGEKGIVPEGHTGAGKPYHLKGKAVYRIIHGFIDQAGAETDSVFGGQFKDDSGGLKLKHDRKVCCSVQDCMGAAASCTPCLRAGGLCAHRLHFNCVQCNIAGPSVCLAGCC